MPTLKKGHTYTLKKQFKKTSRYIDTIQPLDDREVPEIMFNQYEDVTGRRDNEV